MHAENGVLPPMMVLPKITPFPQESSPLKNASTRLKRPPPLAITPEEVAAGAYPSGEEALDDE